MSKELLKQNIEKAQFEIDRKKDMIKSGKMRQHYHFMPQTGWLNDPNGLIYFRGKYHFFFQHNPYSGFWDSMHWGHAVSDDMLHWEYLPLALVPSEKYEGNPVLTAPEGIPTDMFRDPKVWKHEDTYYMVCGASRNNRGMALLYRSKNMLNWEFFNVLAESRGEWGFMWECPDFYPIGDKYVLTFSPMGSGDHTSVYLVGDFDYETGSFYSHVSGEINWGFDYYAPQSFLAPDGRRIMVGWANEWEWMPSWKDWGPTYKEGWCGSFNIPMEVRLMKDSTLQFLPIKEIESLRQGGQFWDNLVVTEDELELKAGDGVTFELKMKIDLEKTDADKLEFTLRCGEGKKTVCMFDFKKAEMTVNRNNADGWSKGISRSVMYLNNKKDLDVHILSDQSSLEIFTSEYQNNHSNNIFAGNFQNQLKVRAYGGSVAIKDIETYGLKDCYC